MKTNIKHRNLINIDLRAERKVSPGSSFTKKAKSNKTQNNLKKKRKKHENKHQSNTETLLT